MSKDEATRTLSTADERRATLIRVALPIFAEQGFRSASTVQIATAAGISQAYLFRLFPTKTDLFVAAYEAGRGRILEIVSQGADDASEDESVLHAMGVAYGEMLESERDLLQIQLQAQVVAGEPRIAEAAQRTFNDLYALASERSGATAEELRDWFATGMLMNVMAAIGAPELTANWADTLCMKEE